MKLPEDYWNIWPTNCVISTKKWEHERIFKNILCILYRTQNVWRELSWEEYKIERWKDDYFREDEKSFFNAVLPYTLNPEVVKSFSSKLR